MFHDIPSCAVIQLANSYLFSQFGVKHEMDFWRFLRRPNQNEIQILTARVTQQPEAFYFHFESFVSTICAKKHQGDADSKNVFCPSIYSDRYSDGYSVRCPPVGPLLFLSSFLL